MSFVTNFGLKAIHSKAFCCRYLHSTSASSFFLPTNIKRGYSTKFRGRVPRIVKIILVVLVKRLTKVLVGCCMLMMLSYDIQFEGQQ
jgi:hypothetical protein